MYRRLILGVGLLPFLAQTDGCNQQDVVGLVTVLFQTLVTSLLPLLLQSVLGLGGTAAAF